MATKNGRDQLSGDEHKKLGIALFNHAWKLMKKKDRTDQEVDEMIHTAHSSRYHWSRYPGCSSKEISIGEWQISRMYALLSRPEACLWHARRCLAASEQPGIEAWLLAFAHEAMARAYACAGAEEAFNTHYDRAYEISDLIEDPEDKALLLSDLRLAPWFGLVIDDRLEDPLRDD